MARMPGATWRPVPNCTKDGQESVHGVVLHIMEGTLDGSDSWFRNPSSQASSHFGVGTDGRIYQWVDTADRAWAQAAGNRDWLSIEHEGHAGDSLTAAQLAATARILAWAHTQHGVPLQSTDSVDGRGLGWHGMGGSAWGGHTGCPGDPIKAQRGAIIAAAKGGPTHQQEDGMTPEQARQLKELHDSLTPYQGWGYRNAAAQLAAQKAGKSIPDAYGYLTGIHAAVQQLTAQVGALSGALTALTNRGGLTADQVQAAAQAGATAALHELGETLTKES